MEISPGLPWMVTGILGHRTWRQAGRFGTWKAAGIFPYPRPFPGRTLFFLTVHTWGMRHWWLFAIMHRVKFPIPTMTPYLMKHLPGFTTGKRRTWIQWWCMTVCYTVFAGTAICPVSMQAPEKRSTVKQYVLTVLWLRRSLPEINCTLLPRREHYIRCRLAEISRSWKKYRWGMYPWLHLELHLIWSYSGLQAGW